MPQSPPGWAKELHARLEAERQQKEAEAAYWAAYWATANRKPPWRTADLVLLVVSSMLLVVAVTTLLEMS